MTEAAAAGQASGQSSSSSSGQSQAGSSAAPGAGSEQSQQASSQQAAPQRPAYVLESEWDATAGKVIDEKFGERVNALSAREVEARLREQAVPASADKYEIKLPEGFKPPDGFHVQFKEDDPTLAEARKVAHEMKLDQAGFSRLLGVYAATEVSKLQNLKVAHDAQMAKLGTAGPQRIEAIETWLTAKVGDASKVFVETLKKYPVAANVEMAEGLIRAFSAQGGTNFSQQHRETEAEAGKIPGYDKMSFEQRRLAQDQQRSRRTA